MSKVDHYKVWIHIEGLNEDGDCVEGDEFFEPHEAGCFKTPAKAESLRSKLVDIAGIITGETK